MNIFIWLNYNDNKKILYGKKDSFFRFQMHVGPDFPCMIITYTLIWVPAMIYIWQIVTVPTFFFIINVAFDFGYSVINPTLILWAVLILAFSKLIVKFCFMCTTLPKANPKFNFNLYNFKFYIILSYIIIIIIYHLFLLYF